VKYQNQLKDVQRDIKSQEDKITQKDTEIAEVTQWLTIMKKFKQELANEKLRVIQSLANHHLEEMGVDVQLKIDGYKMLASGEVREEITGYVIDKGEMVEYSSQSKGERIRIDYAIILAIRSLLNASSDTGGIDLLFSDEITEGLDDLGTESLLEALSKTDNTILFTTHVLPDNIFPNMLYVRKINDVSQITEN
jgi:DNA repair exonuclease SbcCD ATPase subunit